MDIRPNFFSAARPGPAQVVSDSTFDFLWANDKLLRANFGLWLYENFDDLALEYKKHGRFLSLQEIGPAITGDSNSSD